MRLAFGTIRGLPDPSAAFGDAESVRTRFRAAPEHAWSAELDGDVVGSVFAARWGSFGFLGPLSVHPERWDRGIGSRLLQPVLDAFTSWNVRQVGLFTFADSPKHLGLYQRHGFWPGSLTVVTAKEVGPTGTRPHALFSNEPKDRHDPVLDEIRGLTERDIRRARPRQRDRRRERAGNRRHGSPAQRRRLGGDGRVSLRRRERGGQ